jgi:ferric-dicitrate binding protein FerR (iron transport regulator)
MSILKPENVNYNELIASYIAGNISDVEREELSSWIASDSINQKYFKEYVTSWHYAATLADTDKHDAQVAWNTLKNRIQDKEDNELRDKIRYLGTKQQLVKKILSIAAAVIMTFFAGGLTAYYLNKNGVDMPSGSLSYQITTPNGTRSELVLADGTQVWLNAGSTLKYDPDYSFRSREVELIGEAYFQVKKNTSKPFTVKSAGLVIKALGTSFNVKAYPDDQRLTATVVEGKITVEGKVRNKDKFKYTLNPGQNLVLLKSTEALPSNINGLPTREVRANEDLVNQPQDIRKIELEKNVKTELYTSWKDRRWIIEQESFSNLAIMLERRYNVKFVYDQNKLQGLSFSGTIENETLEQVLKVLQLSAPIKFEIGRGEVAIALDESAQDRFNKFKN